ncbi:hypothetical protein [Agromyces mariniharenae]|uniref:Uncharacterized protein n=1 Tax=Agromyces mariniharenae TaxID=2604423 RepID=A0A5S4VEL9_9MICO|nr:hypothetical protein [Agromyces mariniharenae]TYL52475.1 hypothetical protein FYC51_01575 [Agromyces mariniharenae]
MRWDLLFDDLESQLDQEQRDEERALALEEERLRLARLTLRDRLIALSRAGDGGSIAVRVELMGGTELQVRPLAFGRDWMSATVAESGRGPGQCLVPLGAIAAVLPSRSQVGPSLEPGTQGSGRLSERIGLPFVLRDLCRRRTPIHLTTKDGRVHGTIDRVARDHLDLAVHEPGTARRDRDVRGIRIVPIGRIVLVAFD